MAVSGSARSAAAMAVGTQFPRGFRVGAAAAGVKDGVPDRADVALIVSDRPCVAAGVFTTNKVIAAPCVLTRRHVESGAIRAIVVNAGNANACTGDRGERDALAMAEAAAAVIGARAREVAVASTGVIGVPLPVERIVTALRAVRLDAAWEDAARAIMTTDTRPKLAARAARLAQGTVHVGGIAKGAGMIHPDMATLLAFVMTDAQIDRSSADELLRGAVRDSFNAISVDGDTSTNDMVLLLANGASGVEVGRDDRAAFKEALDGVCADLARAVVADGEGATKVFEVHVIGAASADDARRAARTITSSDLVKTAIHGADPNWGRILAAAGRSGAQLDQRRASVRIADVIVFDRGTPRAFDGGALRRILERPTIEIEVDLGLGSGSARAWGSDLSAEYVRINAEYTT